MSAFLPDSFIVADVAPSPNFDERKDARAPDMILLHYTGMQTGQAALQQLTKSASKVSSHYVVFEDGRIQAPVAGYCADTLSVNPVSVLLLIDKSRSMGPTWPYTNAIVDAKRAAEGLLLPTMQDTGLAFLNATLDVKAPTVVGDTIHVEAEVTDSAGHTYGARRSVVATSCSMNSGWPSSIMRTAAFPAQNAVISSGTSG